MVPCDLRPEELFFESDELFGRFKADVVFPANPVYILIVLKLNVDGMKVNHFHFMYLFTGFSFDALIAAFRDHITFLESIFSFKLPQFREDVFKIV